MLDKSTLLIFAHRGEARAFLKHFEMTPFAQTPLELYQNSQHKLFLLLTGEGVHEALCKTSAALGVLNQHSLEVINIGIAGSLHQNIRKGQICKIRTSYAQESMDKMQFKSYTLLEGEVDLVSASQRIIDSKSCQYLQAFAPVVDRELWGVAKAAQLFSVPVKSYKYITDEVWSLNEAQFCERIKEEAQEYSEELLQFYLNQIMKGIEIEDFQIQNEFESFYQIPGTHFTVSMKKKMDGLLKSLSLKNEYPSFLVQAQEQIKKDIEVKTRPKTCAQNCLQLAQQTLMPFDHQVELALNKLAAPFNENGIEIQFDPSRELSSFWLKTQIQHPKHLEKLKNAIDKFDYQQLEQILQGKIDV